MLNKQGAYVLITTIWLAGLLMASPSSPTAFLLRYLCLAIAFILFRRAFKYFKELEKDDFIRDFNRYRILERIAHDNPHDKEIRSDLVAFWKEVSPKYLVLVGHSMWAYAFYMASYLFW